MECKESLVINFWENPEEQLLQIEKEILLPQIEDRLRFLEDYKQALHEFLDIFDSDSFLKKKSDCYYHIPTAKSESLASMLFRKYSIWNHECESYDINVIDELSVLNSYIRDLLGLKELLPHLNELLNLFSTSDSNEKFINECISRFSLSRSIIQFILSLSLSDIKNANPQTIEDDIDKYSAISEFLERIIYGFWERQVEEDNAEVTYFYDSRKKEWEKISKMEYEPSFMDYTWDKQNENWKLIVMDDVVDK